MMIHLLMTVTRMTLTLLIIAKRVAAENVDGSEDANAAGGDDGGGVAGEVQRNVLKEAMILTGKRKAMRMEVINVVLLEVTVVVVVVVNQ